MREIRILRLMWLELETDPEGTALVFDPTLGGDRSVSPVTNSIRIKERRKHQFVHSP